jgi:hypothetical protein
MRGVNPGRCYCAYILLSIPTEGPTAKEEGGFLCKLWWLEASYIEARPTDWAVSHSLQARLPRFARLGHRVMIDRRVAAGDKVFKLALDIREQTAGAQPEEIGVQPVIAKLLLHQDQPVK